jgi:hypothetical protein
VQQKLRLDAEEYVSNMRVNLLQQHNMMQQSGGTFILSSHVFGCIRGAEGAQVPALLMDRAGGASLEEKLQHSAHIKGMRPHRPQGQAGLG